jgi:hypothetical protein
VLGLHIGFAGPRLIKKRSRKIPKVPSAVSFYWSMDFWIL